MYPPLRDRAPNHPARRALRACEGSRKAALPRRADDAREALHLQLAGNVRESRPRATRARPVWRRRSLRHLTESSRAATGCAVAQSADMRGHLAESACAIVDHSRTRIKTRRVRRRPAAAGDDLQMEKYAQAAAIAPRSLPVLAAASARRKEAHRLFFAPRCFFSSSTALLAPGFLFLALGFLVLAFVVALAVSSLVGTQLPRSSVFSIAGVASTSTPLRSAE